MDQPVESLMKTTMQSIKNMIDVNTVVGDAVETKDGTVIVPISKVSFAFVAGGGEYSNKTQNTDTDANKMPFAGGSGAGVTVQPLGFLTTNNGQLRMLPVNYNNTLDRVIDLVPQVVENVENYLNKRSEKHIETDDVNIQM